MSPATAAVGGCGSATRTQSGSCSWTRRSSPRKVAGVETAIRAAGASLMPLPPYSPDLNPIEQLFAKLKALLRKAKARTRDALWSTIGHILEEFTPDECRRYITNSGYAFV